MGLLFIKNGTLNKHIYVFSRYAHLSKGLVDFLCVKGGDYISFAQDSKNPKQFYLVPGVNGNKYNYLVSAVLNKLQRTYIHMIGAGTIIRVMRGELNLPEKVSFRMLISDKPVMINGVNHYPIKIQ